MDVGQDFITELGGTQPDQCRSELGCIAGSRTTKTVCAEPGGARGGGVPSRRQRAVSGAAPTQELRLSASWGLFPKSLGPEWQDPVIL